MKPRRRTTVMLLALFMLSATATAQPGIAAMDQAIKDFLGSGDLFTRDSHWSRKQQEWQFKFVADGDAPVVPRALNALLTAFLQNTAYGNSCYFHDSTDGQAPFNVLVYERGDDFYGGIVGRYRIDNESNFRILNFKDSAGLVSYGMVWRESTLANRHRQPFRTIDGQLFKFYGGIWTMQPFLQYDPWAPRDDEARVPLSRHETVLYETLLAQTRHLANEYDKSRQAGNETGCDAMLYMMKRMFESYEGRLTRRQWAEVAAATPVFAGEEAHGRRADMLGKALGKLSEKVERKDRAFLSYAARVKGVWIKPDDVRLMWHSYDFGDSGKEKPVSGDGTIETRLTGVMHGGVPAVWVTPIYPRDTPYKIEEATPGNFSFVGEFKRGQLLEVSDHRGHKLVVFADTVPAFIDLKNYMVKGSEQNERMACCQRYLRDLKNELERYAVIDSDGDLTVMDREGYERFMADVHRELLQMMEDNRDNLIPAWLLADNVTSMSIDELSGLLKHGRPYTDHIALQPVWQYYEGLKLRQPGQQFHDVECLDTLGVRHCLSDYIGRGDYVVLHLWSISKMHTNNLKLMKQFCKEYADKNLRVIALALDSEAQLLQSYTKSRGLQQFLHLTALIDGSTHDWESPVAKAYGIITSPETIVFDPQGRIMASGLTGDRLKQYIGSLPLK